VAKLGKRKRVQLNFSLPSAYPPELTAAMRQPKMAKLEKDAFIRYVTPHLFNQQPQPTPTEYAAMARACIEACPSLRDPDNCTRQVSVNVNT